MIEKPLAHGMNRRRIAWPTKGLAEKALNGPVRRTSVNVTLAP